MGFFRQLIAVLALLCATCAHAEVVEGKDYKLLNPPQPTSGGKKVEVLEFFFYECSHCEHLHGPLDAWEKRQPKDVELEYVPVIFRESLEPMARTFYALEALGQQKRLHDALFDAWHVQNIDLSDEAKITAFVAKHGVDSTKFEAAYNSFSVASKLNRSNQMVRSYHINGTPTITVDGKYSISELGPEEMIRVLDEVVKIARKERNKH
jgi:protein dithiol oxidoreductase (disulfide-forming)